MGDLVVRVKQLSVVRGGRCVVGPVDLDFAVGVTAVLGPNGAGKTSLFETLLAPGRSTGGFLTLDGTLVEGKDATRRFFAATGFMPQDWRFVHNFSALESVAYAAWLKGFSGRQVRSVAYDALGWVDLQSVARVKVRKLSGGMRQRVGLAEAFVGSPRFVLLDEPTVGLDPGQRAEFRALVRARAETTAVVISTHLTDDVAAIADRVLVLDEGRIRFDGTPSQLAALGSSDAHSASAIEAGYLAVVSPAGNAT